MSAHALEIAGVVWASEYFSLSSLACYKFADMLFVGCDIYHIRL